MIRTEKIATVLQQEPKTIGQVLKTKLNIINKKQRLVKDIINPSREQLIYRQLITT